MLIEKTYMKSMNNLIHCDAQRYISIESRYWKAFELYTIYSHDLDIHFLQIIYKLYNVFFIYIL